MTEETKSTDVHTGPPQDQEAAETAKAKKPLWKRLLKVGLFLVYILILAELGSRAYWMIKHREREMPFFASMDDWYDRFYEEIRDSGVLEARPQRGDGYYDVLFLGGSALDRVHRSLVQDEQLLPAALEQRTGLPARVFNLASPGMTTLDSLLKYRRLVEKGCEFDLVVVYHGINDARMNNCPPEKFETDYSHAGFYQQLERMRDYDGALIYFTLPYTVEYTVIHLLESKTLDTGVYLPRHKPKPGWEAYGTDIKTEKTFRENLRGICDLAAVRKEPVLLCSFAWYLPGDYSLEKLEAGELDYHESVAPSAVELWGSVEGVTQSLRVHNEVIREVAANHDTAELVDLRKRIPTEGDFFNDICHLSEPGKKQWMQILLPAIPQSRGGE